MGISTKARRAPLRLSTGAFILNSGLTKFTADDETAKRLQAAATAFAPQLERVDPRTFSKGLAVGEVTLGTALLLPIVPPAVAGAGLSAFAGSLLTMWWKTPGMHRESSIRPTPEGVPVAKDVWMLGSGMSLLLDALLSPAHDKHVEVSATVHEKAAAKRRHLRRARRRAQLGAKVHDAGGRLQEAAGERLHDATERLVELRDEYQPVAAKKMKKARKKARKQSKQLAKAARASAHDASERIQQAVA
jgi:uncharacterized membrane protein YphA (DoxX/SURF4 family)